MTRVAVSGAGGKLATPIARAIAEADDLDLVALYNPNRAGSEMMGISVSADPETVDADVIIETAHPDVVFDNLAQWNSKGSAVVVGTSGFTPERLGRLSADWGEESPCLVVPNFAIGAVLMMKYAREAAAQFEAVEVVERHHSTKPDAPSGTALATAMGVSEGGGGSVDSSDELVAGARGASVEGVRVHAVRLSRADLAPGGFDVQSGGGVHDRASFHEL